jgi:hypothetical protein
MGSKLNRAAGGEEDQDSRSNKEKRVAARDASRE